MPKPKMPCTHCGGEKQAGRGRKACDACLEKLQPIFEQARYRERLERSRALRVAVGADRKLGANAPAGQKWCARCRQYLALGEFGGRGTKLAAYCRPCASAYNHERILSREFGITPARYDELLALQGGRCAVCERHSRTRRLAVDHDHETGEIRGLLCTRCNHKLIGAANESPAVLRRAARYLDAPPALTGRPVAASEADLLELRLAAELDRAESLGGEFGIVWMSRPGKASPGDGYVTMTGATLVRLLAAAGYTKPETEWS